MSKQNEILEAAKTTLQNSTIHAIPNMLRNSKFGPIKLMWLVCFVASAAGCVWFIADLVAKYFEREVVTRINIKPESEMPFPKIYICDEFGPNLKVPPEKRIIEARFDKTKLSSDEFYQENIGKFNCIRLMSRVNPKYVQNRPVLANLELDLFVGPAIKINGSPNYGLSIRIDDHDLSAASQYENINISPGTSNSIYLKKTLVKKQPFPYSDCIHGLDSKVCYF